MEETVVRDKVKLYNKMLFSSFFLYYTFIESSVATCSLHLFQFDMNFRLK